MLYIALICIAAGLMLLLLPMVFRVEKRRYIPAGDSYVPSTDYPPAGAVRGSADAKGDALDIGAELPRGGEKASPFDYKNESYRMSDELPDIAEARLAGLDNLSAGEDHGITDDSMEEGIFDELERQLDDVVPEEDTGESHGDASGISAALFEDEAGAFNLNDTAGAPDPDALDFSKLRRLGKGRLEEVRDGLNFHLGKAFYRFDFHRIERARSSEKFLALKLKGGSSVRVFLFEKPTSYGDEIARSIQNYRDGMEPDVLSL